MLDGSPMHRGLIAAQPIEMVVECVTGGGAWEMNGDWYCLPSVLSCTLRVCGFWGEVRLEQVDRPVQVGGLEG